MACEHHDFNSFVNIFRLKRDDGDDTSVTNFIAEITIECNDCGVDFCFKGLPGGMSFDHPAMSPDCREARMPIEPED